MQYIETNCVVEHQGKKFESGGAFVSPEYIRAYLGKNGDLTDWHGNKLGTYRITRTWKIRSCYSEVMNQVYALVDGFHYTGRSMGEGMIFNGRITKP